MPDLDLLQYAQKQEIVREIEQHPRELQEKIVYKLYMEDVTNTLKRFPKAMQKQFCVELIEQIFEVDA